MSGTTTIQIDKKLLKELKELKDYPEQTYKSLLRNLIDTYKKVKERDQYDKFLHYIQQKKMKELWDNKHDENWE